MSTWSLTGVDMTVDLSVNIMQQAGCGPWCPVPKLCHSAPG